MAFTDALNGTLESMETAGTENYGEVMAAWTEEFGEVIGATDAAPVIVTKPWFPYMLVMDYIIIVFGIFGNVLTIYAFLKYPVLQTPTNYLICNQSLVDIIFLLTSQMFVWVNYSKEGLEMAARSKYACLFSLWAVLFSLHMSITNLFLLSSERLVAIFWSLHYFTWVTERSVKRVLAVCWVVTNFINILPMLGWNTWHPGATCVTMQVYPPVYTVFFYLLPLTLLLLLTTLINIIICTIAARKNKVGPIEQHPQQQRCLPICSKPPANTLTEEQLRSHNSGQYKITKMFLMVVGVFYLSLLPYIIFTLLHILAPFPSWRLHGHPEWFLLLHDVSKGMLGLNALFNPLIYASRNAKFKVAFMRIFGLDPSKTLSETS